MPQFRPTTGKTLLTDMRKFVNHVAKEVKEHDIDEKGLDQLAGEFNEWMDSLLGQDYFGTEGQLDPRGDHRD
jgi:hypothetical protein